MASIHAGYENDTPAEGVFAGTALTFRAKAYKDSDKTIVSTEVASLAVALTEGDGTAVVPTPTLSGNTWGFTATLKSGTTHAQWTFTDGAGNAFVWHSYVTTKD